MNLLSNIICTFLLLFFSTNIICAQFTSTQTCLGGNNDDFLGTTAYNFSTNQNFSFKTKDGGSIYFGKSNSNDGTFSPNNRYYDIVVIKISADGELEFTKNIGSVFSEHNFIVTQSNDSSKYFILIESYSNDSFYDDYYNGNIIIKHSLKCINQYGNELWDKLLRVGEYSKVDSNYFPSPHYENQINLFTDKQDNNLTFFEKINFDTIVHQYIIDSIFYNQIDKNGNINWTNVTTPFAIYNNTKPELRIDTFFNYSFRTNNNFASTSNKYYTTANLSNNRNYSTALYTLDYSNGNITKSILIDSIDFNICSVKNNILLYGDKSTNDYNNSLRYSSFIYKKYDENLNVVYEKQFPYNETETYSHYVNISPMPYFNSDSTKIWFDTYTSVVDFDLYYGIVIGIHSKTFTYANIVDEQSGNLIKQVDLNKLESNFIVAKMNDVFYYLSANLSQDSIPNSEINAYNFDGTIIHSKTLDSVFFINNNPNSLGFIFNQSVYNNQSFSNIPNTFALEYNTIDSLYNLKTGFLILDTMCNLVMSATENNFIQNYLVYKFHIIDTNKYCLITSIINDTISGCYPNTNNIVLKIFSKSILSSIKNLNKNDTKFIIFPNPNSGNFTIDFTSKGNYPINITLFDVTGKIVYQETLQHNDKSMVQISETILASGLYNIQISGADEIWNNKVLITK